MPRVRKPGGLRVGAPGVGYPNRSDLNANKNLPATVATGQTYGLAGQQLEAQRNIPMAPQPTGVAGAPTPGGMAPGAATPTPSQGPPPAPPIQPGGFGPLARPTERPGEPVTTGLPIGAGAGPEAMPPSPQGNAPGGKMSDMLNQIAQQTGSSTIAAIAARAQAMGT